MTAPVFEVSKSIGFEAAHFLGQANADPRYMRVHGHSFRIEVVVRGPAHPETGWVVDLAALDTALKGLHDVLDHACLNDLPGLERPTLERLCTYVADVLRPDFPALARVSVSRPSLSEACTLVLG